MTPTTTGKSRRQTVDSLNRPRIGVTALKGFGVLFENDLYELAFWLLKLNTAKNLGTNATSRHTVYGLAGVYAMCANLNRDIVINVLEGQGLPLGATIEYDEDVS